VRSIRVEHVAAGTLYVADYDSRTVTPVSIAAGKPGEAEMQEAIQLSV
jgi:hypothetical protein